MKKNFLSKLLAFCALAFAGGALASCQSVNKEDAKVVVVKESTAKIYIDTTDNKTYATATVGLENNTIYDVYTWDLTYVTSLAGIEQPAVTTTVNMYASHGASGYVTFLEEVDPGTTSAKIISGTPKKMAGIMKSYMIWWIAGFSILAISSILFAFKLFGDAFTREQARAIFKENIVGSLFIAAVILFAIMLPLILGSWVPTVILGGMFVASILINGALTGIKELTVKH